MRSVDDILSDVIDALEPRETLPDGDTCLISPARLHDWEMDLEEGGGVWHEILCVDTGTLIDVAQRRGCTIATMTEEGKTWVEVKRDCLRCQTWDYNPREAAILALAEALGVETEE